MSTRTPELRTFRAPVEFRAAKDGSGGPGTLFGYAAKYNKLSRNLGGFVERIAPGAFDKCLADGVRIMCRYNHERLLGTTDAGTLRVWSDDEGLPYEVDLPDTSWGRDVAVMARRGDVRFSSFAFHVAPGGDEWGFTENDFPQRTLTGAQLVDVAPVDDPAYLDTESGLRSLAEARGLDPAAVAVAAKRNELRALLTSDVADGQGDGDEAEPLIETPSGDERALDVARLRLELLRRAV